MQFFGSFAALLLLSCAPPSQCGQVNSRPTQKPEEVELGPSNTDAPDLDSSTVVTRTKSRGSTRRTNTVQATGRPLATIPEIIPDDQSTLSGITTYLDVEIDLPESSITGDLQCYGSLPKFPYFAWQWGYERSGQALSLTERDFESLSDLCSSPYMRWAYGQLFDYCQSHCSEWVPPINWVPIEPYLARLEEYHDLWDRIRTHTRKVHWAPMECNPNQIDPNYAWPKSRYRNDFPTLDVLCRENYRPIFTPGNRFGLGCECVEEGKPPICPRDNANWPITKDYGSRRTPLKYAKTSYTRISVWEVEDYRLIQDAFIPECESKCICRRITERDVARLEELAADLEKHFPGWYTARGAGAFDRKVQKSYGAFEPGCSSNQQCDRGSQCIAKPVSSTLVMGISTDLVYKAVCVAAVQSMRGKRLGGRDLAGRAMAEKGLLDDWFCPCNVSYVSRACCGSQGGLVYEAPRLKRGILIDAENQRA